jgi:hypothetical protein
VPGDDRPLVLVVCEDLTRLTRTREVLRAAGLLPASARSVEAALSLLTQVVTDACLLVQNLSVEEARQLGERLEQVRPGAPKLCVREFLHGPVDGWMPCAEAEAGEALAAALATR